MKANNEFDVIQSFLTKGIRVFSSHDWDDACVVNPEEYVKNSYIPDPREFSDVRLEETNTKVGPTQTDLNS